jgi:hypothetical protein
MQNVGHMCHCIPDKDVHQSDTISTLIAEKPNYLDKSLSSQASPIYSRNRPICAETKFPLPCLIELSLDPLSNKLNEVYNTAHLS